VTESLLVKGEYVLSEKEWQRQVLDLALLYGWRHAYHTFDSRRSSSGWPDLCLVRERVVFAELKSEKGKVSAAQADWLAALEAAGAETYVWRPSDVVDVMQALRRRAH
jgi:hypothetical protein